MAVMSIGIAALVAGFSSGILSVNRARETSTAGTLADKQMETYRQAAFASLPIGLQARDHANRAGRSYLLDAGQRGVDVRRSARIRAAASCSGTPASRPVKLITITVRDGSRPRSPFRPERDLRLLDRLTTHST